MLSESILIAGECVADAEKYASYEFTYGNKFQEIKNQTKKKNKNEHKKNETKRT
jgi:hypothetical protein